MGACTDCGNRAGATGNDAGDDATVRGTVAAISTSISHAACSDSLRAVHAKLFVLV